jgi:hypothetical protein
MTVVALFGSSIFLFLRKPLKHKIGIRLSCNSENKSDEGKTEVDGSLLIKGEEEYHKNKKAPSFK